jgi:hypothetical protein
MTVAVIAAAHAIPVVISRAVFGKGGALTAAVIMSFVAVAFGGAQYFVIDLAAVWIGAFICLKN